MILAPSMAAPLRGTLGLTMFPVQRVKATNAEVLGIFALLGALAVPALAIEQIVTERAAFTVERAAWWYPFVLAEAFFLLVLAAAWRLRRRRS